MAIDRIELMTLDTVVAATAEDEAQLNVLKQLALHPEHFRLAFFHLPADVRLHAKHALLHQWEKRDVESIGIPDFTAELVEAIYHGNGLTDLKHYENSEILLVDDLQLVTGKESTQEFFYAGILKPRIEGKKTTVLFSEYSYEQLRVSMRDDLRNLLRLGFHAPY